jgi:succinate dehydrogenase/fumarate reductase flavoprotein subunit
MHRYDPVRKELAPRDVVTRAIDFELKKTGGECVYLDITQSVSKSSPTHLVVLSVARNLLTFSCRGIARHPSLRSGRRPIRHFVRDGVP